MVKAVLYYFSLVHEHDENEEQKKGKINRSGASLRAEKLARNSSAIGVPKCSSDSMLSSRYKNGKDPMPSSRYKKRTGDLSPLENSPEGETDRCVLKSGVLAAGCRVRLSCTAPSGPEAPRSRGC